MRFSTTRSIARIGAALLLLAACGDGSDPIPTGSAGVGGEGGAGSALATASTSEATGQGGSDGEGAGGSVASTSSSSITSSAASTSTGEIEDLDALLARLRADLDRTLREESLAGGWPVRVEEGRVVVSTDADFSEVAGDFDAWVGTALTADEGFAWGLVPDEAGARYKLKAGETFASDPWARAYDYDDFGEISFVAPPAAAHLERWPLVESDLAPRTVRAWVPAEAATHVLYVHDGQNLFDPDAFFGGWRLQDAAPPGMLLVGIDNTSDRMDEYTHVPDDIGSGPLGGDGDDYAAFLRDVVRPLVEGRYGEPPIIGTMGSSLGGLISLHVALLDPETYVFAASLSGTLGWGSIGAGVDNETIIQRYEDAGHQPTAIYLDSGGGGDTCEDADGDGTNDDDDSAADNYCETLQMRDALQGLGWEIDVDLAHWWEPDASHDEAAWAARVDMPLAMFAGVE
jgi:predicted alpha/beta superfamily hydrolase